MKISVLLPVYNAGLALKPAIESILSQEFQEFEFIIIGDGFRDGSSGDLKNSAKSIHFMILSDLWWLRFETVD